MEFVDDLSRHADAKPFRILPGIRLRSTTIEGPLRPWLEARMGIMDTAGRHRGNTSSNCSCLKLQDKAGEVSVSF
jgi:hypothetical protein